MVVSVQESGARLVFDVESVAEKSPATQSGQQGSASSGDISGRGPGTGQVGTFSRAVVAVAELGESRSLDVVGTLVAEPGLAGTLVSTPARRCVLGRPFGKGVLYTHFAF